MTTQRISPTSRRPGSLVERGIDGRTRAVNLLVPFRTWFGRVRRFYFWPFGILIAGEWFHFKQLDQVVPFRALRVIHFLTFAMVRDFPYLGGGQARERLKHSYMLLCSCYNGDLHEYLDLFADTIPKQLDSVLGDAPDFVPSRPVTAWKDMIVSHAFETDYFYSAYPEASAIDAMSALRARRAVDAFDRKAADDALTGPAFARALADLVREEQSNLGRVALNDLLAKEARKGKEPAAPIVTRTPQAAPPRATPYEPFRPHPLEGAQRFAGTAAHYIRLLPRETIPIVVAALLVFASGPVWLARAGLNLRLGEWLTTTAPMTAVSNYPPARAILDLRPLEWLLGLLPSMRPELLPNALRGSVGDAAARATPPALFGIELAAAVATGQAVLDMLKWVIEAALPERWRPLQRHPHHSFITLSPIVQGQTDQLRRELLGIPAGSRWLRNDNPDASPFLKSQSTHMLRFAILERDAFKRIGVDEPVGLRNDYLLMHIIADAHPMNPIEVIANLLRIRRNTWRYLEGLHDDTGPLLRRVFGHCVGFPTGANKREFRKYVGRCKVRTQYIYRDTRSTVPQVREALRTQQVLRDLATISAKKRETGPDYRDLQNGYVAKFAKWGAPTRVRRV